MHEPDIAPLARRLAEENNVDWRRLTGTGDGGRVVERDVLGYLARVMAGEEALDPTPEPVPDGMAAWPEGDVAAHRVSGDADDVDERSAPTLDDDLFLFDDPLAGGPPAAGAPPLGATTPPRSLDDGGEVMVPTDEDDLLLVGDDETLDEDVWSAPTPAGAATDADPAGAQLRSGSWDARSLEDERSDPWGVIDTGPDRGGHDLGGPDLVGPELGGSGLELGGSGPELGGSGPELGGSGLELGGSGLELRGSHDALARTAGAPSFDLPDLFAPDTIDEAPADGDAWLFEGEGDADDAQPAQRDVAPIIELADEAPAPAAGAVPLGEADATSVEAVGADDAADAAGDEPGDADEPDVAAADVPFAAVAPAALAAALAADDRRQRPTASALEAVPLDVALVRHGQVWRRRIDDRRLRRAASEVADVLDAPVDVVTATMLALAAQRAGPEASPVDVWRWHAGRAEISRVDARGDVRRAIASWVAPASGAAALIVADLSALDLDEAVLHLDAPLLTLGRGGPEGAWLTLSGDDVDPRFVDRLAKIATLLASPVRLLV